jgi:NAD(P)-dependent dehydrogenase (short-subunit alcohol dehydrogenase family)
MMSAALTMTGKTCLVTGATSGIGLVTARELARMGGRVLVVGRNPTKTESVVTAIRTQTGSTAVEPFLADLSSQRQVRELAKQVLDRHPRLDVLVNNAGGAWLKRQLTVDGLEMTFAVNHLAYFLLTQLLLDRLKTNAPARIVNVASNAHGAARIDFENLNGERSYSGWRQYCRTKLMNILFTYELARRLDGPGVTVNAVHPGYVATGFGGHNGIRGWLWQRLADVFAIDPDKGARTPIYLASSPEVESVTGRYFVKNRAVASSAASYDEATARRLWQVSEELTTVTPTPS